MPSSTRSPEAAATATLGVIPMPTTARSAASGGASSNSTTTPPSVVRSALTRGAGAEVHAVVAVQARDHRSHRGADDPTQWHGLGFQYGDLDPESDCSGGDFEADETCADQHHPLAGGQRRTQPLRVVDRAQVVHQIRARPGYGQRSGPAAGGEQHRVGENRWVPVELDGSVKPDQPASPRHR